MNSDIQSRLAIIRGFRRGQSRLEELRRKEIRESDIRIQLPSFNGLFEASLTSGIPREPYGLSKAMRVFFGVDK